MSSGATRARQAATGLLVAVLVSTWGGVAATPASAALGAITVGSKNFVGSEVLSQVYGQALAAKGAQVNFRPDVGPTEATFRELEHGQFDAYGEYQGTLLEFLGGTPSHDTQRTHNELAARLRPLGLIASTPAPAVDVNGFYVTRKTANKFHLTTVSDLKKVAPKMVFGGPPECVARPLCLGSTSDAIYGLRFKSVKQLDTGGPATRGALVSGRIDVALLFTGSSVIPRDAVLLRDDRGLQPADNPLLVVRMDAATPEVLDVVDTVSAQITTIAYRKMSLEVSVRHLDPADVAATFLAEHDLP
jgi:osmoprotectant transport system substrate-binding protein